jgi:glycosyltransferase involved in cell wall biosynthesis
VRFLFVSAVFPPAFDYGGIPHRVFGLAEALISLGHPCQVITTNAGGSQNLKVEVEKPTTYYGVPVIYTERWRNNSYFYAPRLIRHLRELAPFYDAALVSGGWGYINIAVRLSLPRVDLPYILNPEGLFDPWALRHKHLKKLIYWHLIERRNYMKAAGIVALTEFEADQARQYVPQVPIRVIPNGTNPEHFQCPGSKEALAAIFPVLANSPYILFLSRLHPKKGLDLLFPAFQRLLALCREHDSPEPYLVVAGDGEQQYKHDLENLVQRLEIRDRVLFTGLVIGEAKLALLHHCSFMVLPSRGEGLPMAVLEAMACGKPVVLTRGCYLPEVARAGAGLEVELEVEPMVEAMMQLWIDHGMRLEMGERASQLVAEKYTWHRIAEQTVNFCEQILHR